MLKRNGRVLWWRWRHNLLKRRSDIAEAWIGVAAVAVLVLVPPAVGVVTAAAAERSELDQARGLHRVTAHLVEDAPAALSRFSGATGNQVQATVRWTTSGGALKSGTALVKAGSKNGASTAVWLDDAGRVQPTPPTAAQAREQGAAVGSAAGAGVAVLALGGWWTARVKLDRRRWARWDRDWAEFDSRRGHRHA